MTQLVISPATDVISKLSASRISSRLSNLPALEITLKLEIKWYWTFQIDLASFLGNYVTLPDGHFEAGRGRFHTIRRAGTQGTRRGLRTGS